MSPESLSIISKFIYESIGILLGADKEYLIIQRLEPIAREYNFPTLDHLALALKSPNSELRSKVINAMTTNETLFFRDTTPFEDLRTHVFPSLIKTIEQRKSHIPERRGAKASIWSAACSTGQEPYTLAMIISELIAGSSSVSRDDFSITGTDIDSKVLAKAVEGEYNDFEMGRGVSEMRKSCHFDKTDLGWSVKEELKQMVSFRQINLLHDFTTLGGFDIILCRNVLIYFDIPTRQRIIERMHGMLNPGGVLLVGSIENLYGISDSFQSVTLGSTPFYRPK